MFSTMAIGRRSLSVPRSVSDTIVAIAAIVKQLILMSSELNAA